jgi:iron complex outermembrane receptor protein
VGSSLFGPDAMGGAVNFIVKKPKTKNMVLELSAGSHEAKSGIFSISDKIENLGFRFSLEREESEGFRYDTDFKKFTTRLDSSMDLPCGEFNLGMGYLEKEFGAYDFYTPGLGYPSKEWTKTYLLNTGMVLDKEGFMIKPNFLWRRHYDKFMLDKTQVRTTYLNHHRTDIFTPNIYFQKEVEGVGRVGLGLEYGEELINSTNLGKRNRKHRSIFMDESKDLTRRTSFGLSGRWDDFDGFESIYTGSVNARYRLSQKDALHLGVSRSMRIPSFTELYYNDPTTIGSPGLSAEKSLSYEAGYDYKKERLALGITFFQRQETDLIDWIKRTPAQAKWQVENITKDEVTGIESYLNLAFNKRISLISNYTYINKNIDDQGYLYKYGANYIRHLVNTTLTFSLPFGTQGIGLTYKKRPQRDGWVLLQINLNYSLNKHSQAFCKISNLLNVEYQEIKGIPQPGRWIELGLRLEW